MVSPRVKVSVLGAVRSDYVVVDRATGGLSPEPPTASSAWAELCAANDRLFDGPIYSVRSSGDGHGCIVVTIDSYRRLVIQAHPAVGDLGVRLLGVKAQIFGRDHQGHEHVLIGRRHPQTRTYGGLWEIGPGGGVGPGDVPADRLSPQTLLEHLAVESRQELGIELEGDTCQHGSRPLLLEDDIAHSVDIVYPRLWRGAIDPRGTVCRSNDHDWEYLDSAWLSRADAPGFVDRRPDAVSPATKALLAFAGWIRS